MTDTPTPLHDLFHAALDAAMPDGKFLARMPKKPKGRTLVLGAGKASARMACAFEAEWQQKYPGVALQGLVVTRYGHARPTRFIEIVEAAHPVPDNAGFATARRILDMAASAGPDDLVVFLISGGASALLSLPAAGVSFAQKQQVNKALLQSGAPIGAMNKVRKSLSAIKGGKLAAAASAAQLVTFLISDVPGDDPAAIGSGPTIAEDIHAEEIFDILTRYAIEVPDAVAQAIRAHVCPPPAPRASVYMLATPQKALEAAAARARAIGLHPVILSDRIEGEAREVARAFAGMALSQRQFPTLAAQPMVLLSGGETTVTVRGKGRGGRNAEFLLAFLEAIGQTAGISAIACDTDGIDGIEDNAGAYFDAGIFRNPKFQSLKIADFLANNDAYNYFSALQSLVNTGPTLTNVNDFRAIIITAGTG